MQEPTSAGAAKAIATGQWMAMVSVSRQRPGGESVDDRTMGGADKSLDGERRSRQGATDDTTTNH